jgi:hypothetical protein
MSAERGRHDLPLAVMNLAYSKYKYESQSKISQRSANLGQLLIRFRLLDSVSGPSLPPWGNDIQQSVGCV